MATVLLNYFSLLRDFVVAGDRECEMLSCIGTSVRECWVQRRVKGARQVDD